MNKRDAKAKSLEGDITIGELRQMIEAARNRGGMSRVNPQFTLAQTCDIYAAAIDGRPDDECPAGMKADPYSRSGRMKPSKDSLLVRNVLRDCA